LIFLNAAIISSAKHFLNIRGIPMKIIIRMMLAFGALAAALCFNIPTSQAYGDAPWCAVVSTGAGDVEWDCHYYSVQECRPNVIAGNRGFCNLNPWYVPMTFGPRKHSKRHVRRN
jgi:hypothetical protein